MDLDQIAGLAKQSGYQQDLLEKVVRLGRLAQSISEHPLLSKVLALKGGTALNMFDGQPPRLSVDLDFNYVGSMSSEAMLDQRPDIERAVEGIAREQSYTLQLGKREHAGGKTYLRYLSASGSADRVEIDLVYTHRIPLAPLRRASMWQPGDLHQPDLQICGLEEIAAGKIAAMLDRYKPRDLFDVIRLPESGVSFWNEPSFKKLVIAYTGILVHPLTSYGRERLERIREEDIRAELLPMLGVAKDVHRDRLIDRAWQAVQALLDLDESEVEFVNRLQVGDLQLDLLFPVDSPMREKLERWPPLLWKAQNARNHSTTRPRRGRPTEG